MEGRKNSPLLSKEWLIPLGVLAVSFVCGGIVGLAFGGAVDGAGGERLAQYLTAYLELAAEGTVPAPLGTILWGQLKPVLCALALGFSVLGLVGLPLLLGVQGFSLVYSATCFCRIFGTKGLVIAAFLFGITGVIAVPTLLVLGVQGMQGGCAMLRRQGGRGRWPLPYDGAYFQRCIFCLVAVGVAVLLEWLVVPNLLISAAPLVVQ